MLDNNDTQNKISTVFGNLVTFIAATNRKGACHDTSAILYILSSELGLNPTLCIGEVYAPHLNAFFDHSWVEIEGNVYDAAIAYPLDGGVKVSGPIFNSIDLGTGQNTNLEFGSHSAGGLDDIATGVSKWKLDEYEKKTQSGIWILSSAQCKQLGLDLSAESLRLKYGNQMRKII